MASLKSVQLEIKGDIILFFDVIGETEAKKEVEAEKHLEYLKEQKENIIKENKAIEEDIKIYKVYVKNCQNVE